MPSWQNSTRGIPFAFLMLIVGSLVVLVHNVWVMSYAVLPTLLDWGLPAYGVFHIVFMKFMSEPAKSRKKMELSSGYLHVTALFMTFISFYLTYMFFVS